MDDDDVVSLLMEAGEAGVAAFIEADASDTLKEEVCCSCMMIV